MTARWHDYILVFRFRRAPRDRRNGPLAKMAADAPVRQREGLPPNGTRVPPRLYFSTVRAMPAWPRRALATSHTRFLMAMGDKIPRRRSALADMGARMPTKGDATLPSHHRSFAKMRADDDAAAGVSRRPSWRARKNWPSLHASELARLGIFRGASRLNKIFL